jgi:hypothetical protein
MYNFFYTRRQEASSIMLRLIAFIFSTLILVGAQYTSPASAESVSVGPKKCATCHRDEVKVWKASQHAKSFKTVHKKKIAKKILKAVGEKRMKRSAICATCHYTTVEKKGKVKPIAGPACESCHGKASEWISVHNDYGGAGIKREQETPDHKAARIKSAKAAGMIRPEMLYDIAANCMSCHGLANDKLSGEHASAMLDNGHPLNPDYEVVEYSQGSVRHRFYPPNITENRVMTKIEMSRFYVIGQAAALVSAKEAIKKTKHAKYVDAQNKRIAKATAILSKVPAAAAFIAAPSADTGRALADAIAVKDLTGLVGANLPTSFK